MTRLVAITIVGARVSKRPIVVPLLIAINVVVFALTAVQAHSVTNNVFSPLFAQWALIPEFTVANGEWWRLITAGFLHIGPIHLLVNMFTLWVIGRDLEIFLGKIRFTVAYVLSLVGGSVAVYLFGALDQPVAGASGALYGLMGGMLVLLLRLKADPKSTIIMIVLNLIISISLPNISLLGHLGGLVTGALVMTALVFSPKHKQKLWQTGTLFVLVLLLLGLFVFRDQQLLALYSA